MCVLCRAHAILSAVRMLRKLHGAPWTGRMYVKLCVACGPALLSAEAEQLIGHHFRGDHAGRSAAFQQAVQR